MSMGGQNRDQARDECGRSDWEGRQTPEGCADIRTRSEARRDVRRRNGGGEEERAGEAAEGRRREEREGGEGKGGEGKGGCRGEWGPGREGRETDEGWVGKEESGR